MTACDVARPAAALRFRSAARSHTGCRRAINQDRVLDRPEAGLWAVADGMGGHHEGERAADALVTALAAVDHGPSGYAFLADVEARMQAVNADLARDGAGRSGSTLVALAVHDGHYACLWAGDSRAYRLRGGALAPITRDHSLVQALLDEGALPETLRRTHPQRHIVTRAVGASPLLELDRRFAPIAPGDRFLLCSDGLTLCLDEAEIADTLARLDPAGAVETLLATTLARGAPDNVSLIAIEAV